MSKVVLHRKFTDKEVKKAMAFLRAALADESATEVEVSIRRGIHRYAEPGDVFWSHRFNGSLTFRVAINGGARDSGG